MAGDWIKVERALLRKPEVLESAELLGIKRREAVGLFVEYFVWLDEHLEDSRNGLVTHVSRKSVEEALQCTGFAAILERIGWASFDDEAWTMTVINADRHNGNTAKTRALGQKRASRFRNDSVTPTALPEKRREEKRREETTKAKAPARKRATPVPQGFEISPSVKSWAAEKGYTRLDQHLEAFLSKVAAKGYTYIDWDAAFMNCIREDWGRVNSAPRLAVVNERHGSHVPAKIPLLDPRTEMPDDARAALNQFLGKVRA